MMPPRGRDEGSRDLSRGSRGGGSGPRERDRVDPRDVFVEHVDLPQQPSNDRPGQSVTPL